MKYKEIHGDLIKLAQKGKFDVIAHGCNIFATMGAGIAPLMAKNFGADKLPLEHPSLAGDVNKLGQIDYDTVGGQSHPMLTIVNCYTQQGFGRNHSNGSSKPIDYEALTLCMRKINHTFKGKHIGLPKIGAGLAGGSWRKIKNIIKRELYSCNVTVVIYKP